MKISAKLAPYYLIVIVFFGCTRTIDKEQIIHELLVSNELQRKAHLTNDAKMLVGEIADTMIVVQNGAISYLSNKAIEERFTAYFQTIKYSAWDDVIPPIIVVSEDGLSATVMVQKLTGTQSIIGDSLSAQSFILFAWTSEYQFVNQDWKIVGMTSTQKELTKEEASSIQSKAF